MSHSDSSFRIETLRTHDGSGGADRDRTDDLRLAKPALSQLSYGPRVFEAGGPGKI